LQKRDFNQDKNYVSCSERVSSQEFNSISSHVMSFLLSYPYHLQVMQGLRDSVASPQVLDRTAIYPYRERCLQEYQIADRNIWFQLEHLLGYALYGQWIETDG
ncbi:unnamed protein product, partial [Enterobius vermicularis]|uniref:DUF2063 domain-containing protein n=1 Tax=Enterobius vermicularis TaxID=51028 RepID=A0A0N4VPG3_ENTVE